MKQCAVLCILILLSALSGGCAVVPALMTGASFAVPQSASVAITAASTVHKTALIAADERSVDDMMSDKMLTFQAGAMLLAQTGASMEASCLNGEMYVVGEYATQEDRNEIIRELSSLQGVTAVKGVLKPMPDKLASLIEPTIRDSHAHSVIETGLLKELHIKSANVDVIVVQGEAVILGVVANADEAIRVTNMVASLSPKSDTPLTVTSLLAHQDSHDAGLPQNNDAFILRAESPLAAHIPTAAPSPHQPKPLKRLAER